MEAALKGLEHIIYVPNFLTFTKMGEPWRKNIFSHTTTYIYIEECRLMVGLCTCVRVCVCISQVDNLNDNLHQVSVKL